MEQNNRENRKLYVPTNASDRNDYISGFGKPELMVSAVALLLCLIGSAAAISIDEKHIYAAVLISAVIMVTIVSMIWRDRYDESVLEKIRQIIAYSKAQKTYEYVYDDWIESYMGDIKDGTGKSNHGK